MDNHELFVYINSTGNKIKTKGLTVNQYSTNNVLYLVTVGRFALVDATFKGPDGKTFPKYHMVYKHQYELTEDDTETTLIYNQNNLHLYELYIPAKITSVTVLGNSARLNVSFSCYNYDNKQTLLQAAVANTQITVNKAEMSGVLDEVIAQTEVDNLWKAVGDVTYRNNQQDADLADIHSTLDEQAESIEDIYGSIVDLPELRTRMSTAEEDISGLQDDILTVGQSIQDIHTEIGDTEDFDNGTVYGYINKKDSDDRDYTDAEIENMKTYVDAQDNSVLNSVGINASNISTLGNKIDVINGKIPSQASSDNQLADKAFVNSTVNSMAAYYITKDAAGSHFESYNDLISAGTYYSGGQVRVPTRNDYAIVEADETHQNKSARYSYQNNWEYQYTINDTPFTAQQLATLNSGITASDKSKLDSIVSDADNTKKALAGSSEEKMVLTYDEKVAATTTLGTYHYPAKGVPVYDSQLIPVLNKNDSAESGFTEGYTYVRIASGGGFVPLRDNVGHLWIPENPTANYHAASKNYVDILVDGKLDRYNSDYILYGTRASGSQVAISYGDTPVAQSIPQFDENAKLRTNTPTDANHCANKAYVDGQITAQASKNLVINYDDGTSETVAFVVKQ